MSGATNTKGVNGAAVAVLALVGMFCGCAAQVDVPSFEFPSGPKFPMNVCVSASSGLRNARVVTTRGFEEYEVTYGNAIATKFEEMARSLFLEVIISDPEAARGTQDLDAILEAHVSASQDRPRMFLSTQTTRMTVDITLKAIDGRVIWADSFAGAGESALAPWFNRSLGTNRQFTKAIQQILLSATEAIRSAPEIAGYSRQAGPGGR